MIEEPVVVEICQDRQNRRPFTTWLNSLNDLKAKGSIRARLNRVRMGNFGDCKPIAGGIFELRIDIGPGYRVYFGRETGTKIIILLGGEKGTQKRDIEKVKKYWANYRR